MFHSMTNMDVLHEAARKFLPEGNYHFKPTSGGVNNIVAYVEDDRSHQTYILRVYNNGNDSHRVRFEHSILQQLNKMNLSFRIPTTVPSLETGSPHVLLSNGAEASLFEIIPGQLPKLTKVREIGLASGELCSAMSKVQLDLPSPNPPYYDLYKVHHAVTREAFFQRIEESDFDDIRDTTNALKREIIYLEELIQRLLSLNLPKQLIHGDLHYDNVLVVEDGVSGLLDFEFCAYDWRAMELAICLSKYAGEKNAWEYFDQFIEGFMQQGELNDLEISVIPDLINLRILSNVIYFVGRSLAKEDQISTLTTRAKNYLARIEWIKVNRDMISDKIRQTIAKR